MADFDEVKFGVFEELLSNSISCLLMWNRERNCASAPPVFAFVLKHSYLKYIGQANSSLDPLLYNIPWKNELVMWHLCKYIFNQFNP